MPIIQHLIYPFLTTFSTYFCLYFLQKVGYKSLFCLGKTLLSIQGILCQTLGVISVLLHFLLPDVSLLATPLLLFTIGIMGVFAKRKSKLRITKRIIRLLVAETLLCVPICLYAHWLLVTALPVVTVLASVLTLPLEKLVACYYVKKAQKKMQTLTTINVAITGSYGKTSVKNILHQLLSTKYAVSVAPHSYNTPLGVASFINNQLDEKSQIVIFEFGARKKGDISTLCNIVEPAHAIITAVGKVHLATFKSIRNVNDEKTSLIDYVNDNGTVIVGNSVDITRFMRKITVIPSRRDEQGKTHADYTAIRPITDEQEVIYAENVTANRNGTCFTLIYGKEKDYCTTPIYGKHNVDNILFCYALARKLGCDKRTLLDKISTLNASEHRQQIIQNGTITIIDDSYNANLNGVVSLCETVLLFDSPRIVIAQGIVEAGRERKLQNFLVGKHLSKVADYVIVSGKNAKFVYNGLLANGFDAERIFAINDLQQAVEKSRQIAREKGVIVFQNDIPDGI